jgi:hypothetical protein
MSFTGVSAIFSESSQDSLHDSLLELPGVTLKVSPVGMVRTGRKTVVHFQVMSIESGESKWHSLHNTQWRVAQPEFKAVLKKSSPIHIAQDLPLEGETLNLNEQSLAVVLPTRAWTDLDQVQVILTTQDGSLFNLAGRVVRQHQTRIGEVVIGIQLAELSGKTTTSLIEKYPLSSVFRRDGDPFPYPEPRGIRRWFHILLGQPSARHADRRRIPRLPIHTTCAILRPDMAASWRTTP